MIEEHRGEMIEAIAQAALTTVGVTSPAVRRAAYEWAGEFETNREALAGSLPPEVESFVDKIARRAYKVTDEDVQGLLETGWSEDALFELVIATATGAGAARLDIGLTALREARG